MIFLMSFNFFTFPYEESNLMLLLILWASYKFNLEQTQFVKKI